MLPWCNCQLQFVCYACYIIEREFNLHVKNIMIQHERIGNLLFCEWHRNSSLSHSDYTVVTFACGQRKIYVGVCICRALNYIPLLVICKKVDASLEVSICLRGLIAIFHLCNFFNKFSTVFKNTCNVSTCAIRRNADQILQNYCVCIMLMENIVDCWSDWS